MEPKIEKGVPIPPIPKYGRFAPKSSVAYRMKPGDSVFMEGKTIGKVSPLVTRWRTATGFSFTVRTVPGGVRVWRTK